MFFSSPSSSSSSSLLLSMVGNSDRRFLELSAVHPCCGVSPAVLLHSLAALARDILACHRSASFPTHRRTLREVARQVAALLEFLDEARHRAAAGVRLPDPAPLVLSDLHVTFQCLRHLVRDCARRGARAWLLARSGRVSDEFRLLLRSVATALDVFPLGSVGAPAEMEEVVRMVAGQARRVPVGTDPADAAAAAQLFRILGLLQGKVPPDRAGLEGVLRHLQIRTWTECDEESLFLEEEMGAAFSSDELREISLLGGLRGFMLYSRTVVFDELDGRRSSSRRSSSDHEVDGAVVLDHLNLEAFRCPISLALMAEPVTVSSGHTYDRSSIARWHGSGKLTCPVTGERLLTTDVVPNCAVHKLIRQLCRERNISVAKHCDSGRHRFSKTPPPSGSPAAGAARLLCDHLVGKLSKPGSADVGKAVYEARLLAKSSIFDRGCLVEAGAVPLLLALLPSPDPYTQEDAMAAVLNLSKHPRGLNSIFKSGGLTPIVEALQNGLRGETQDNAAATVFYLSSVEEYRIEIGESPEAIPALTALLQKGSTRGKKNAVVALFGLLLFPGNHRRVLAAGAISTLLDLLSSDREDLADDCLAVLAALAERPEGAHAILQSSAVPSLVTMLGSPSSMVKKEYCVSVLLHLCNIGGTRVVNLLDGIPSLMPALYMVLAEGPRRAAKKASSLISVLHGDQVTPALPAAPLGPVQ
uniref:RING-type E3 ubiquitin transferase n=1 Tax=Anthurium amnicola TaxID=1678845 RepID=A0A1D1Z6N2_9ARAE